MILYIIINLQKQFFSENKHADHSFPNEKCQFIKI